jgi:hypothetical protein
VARFDPTSTASGKELLPRAGDAVATIHVPTSASYYEAAIEGLTRLNENMLAAADFPPIYESGVGYRKEKEDTWRHADDVFCSGWGDCEDLAAWRAAELRHTGEDPDARVYVYRSGVNRFHAVVARGDGALEDPSLILGMKVSEQRRQSLPRWEGDTEMDDVRPRDFAMCANGNMAGAGEDMLSRGAIGEDGALLTDPPGTSGWFGSAVRSVGRAARRATSLRPNFPGFPGFQRPPMPGTRPRIPGVMGDDDGTGDQSVSGFTDPDLQDEMLAGDVDFCDGDEGGGTGEVYDEGSGEYVDDQGGEYVDSFPQEEYQQEEYQQEVAAPESQGPNPLEQAAAAAGRGIKSAASAAWDTTKDVFLPIKYGVQTAVAPIKMVKNASQKAAKYLQMPVKALNKVFSFLGGADEVMPEQVGIVDDDDYEPGDEFWGLPGDGDDGEGGEEAFDPPPSQTPRFRTEEVSPGIWQGQVVLPTREPGKAFTLTTTPAPDEESAGERMYNLAQHAANTPAMMALTNPLAFAVLMTMKGTSKIPFGSAFKAVGSGIATAARAVGRGAESVARTATNW